MPLPRPWLARALAPLLIAAALSATACDPSRPLFGDAGHDDNDDGSNPGDAWFLLGQGEFGWDEIEEGERLEMVLGGQGLLMFPMPMHAQGFTLPDDPKDYTDPKVPILDMYLDIEGFNIGFGGHFSRIANYPIPFDILDDGTYEFIYVTIFVPDELANPCDVDEQPGLIHAELETADGDVLLFERNVVIEVPPELGTGCVP